jgi:hypothetical protein
MRLEDEYKDTKILRPGDHIRLAKLAAKIAERKTARTRIEAWAEEGLEHLRDAGVNVPEEYHELIYTEGRITESDYLRIKEKLEA